jgi:hypothetical protein
MGSCKVIGCIIPLLVMKKLNVKWMFIGGIVVTVVANVFMSLAYIFEDKSG